MGAWIETDGKDTENDSSESHPTWVRGLKRALAYHRRKSRRSHPTWVRGLKQNLATGALSSLMSHPTWVRGLKLLHVGRSEERR